MKSFEWKDKKYEYDETLWERIDVPEEYRLSNGCPWSLRYIGPIVDGAVKEEFPFDGSDWCSLELPMYRTFGWCYDLVEPPKVYKFNVFEPFVGCKNLQPTKEWCNWYSRGCGTSYGNVFAHCNSPHVLETTVPKGMWSSDYEVSARILMDIFGISLTQSYNSLTQFISMNLNQLREGIWFLDTGYWLEIKRIKKSSEVEMNITQVAKGFIIASRYTRFEGFRNDNNTIYLIDDDFEQDKDDPKLTAFFGYKLNRPSYDYGMQVGKDGTLTVLTDCIIGAHTPVDGYGTVTIQGAPGTKLTLRNAAASPCIGPAPHDGMSYGRWCPANTPLNKIIIDGVNVICENCVPNFALGDYGTDKLPEVELRNDGTLECPEMHGKRVMVQSGAEGLCGSTKRCKSAIYELQSNVPQQINSF